MKHSLRALSLAAFVILTAKNSSGQIFQTRRDIIEENGYSYGSGAAEDGTKYIYYDKEFTSEHSGKYTQRKVIYFITLDDGTEICSFFKIIEPSSETNPWVTYFRKNFVQIDYMKWKDYESGILYILEVEEGLCVVTAMYDFEKQ